MSYTIHGNDWQTIGYSMATLNGGPCLTLPLLLLGSIAAFIAYGSRLDEELGTL